MLDTEGIHGILGMGRNYEGFVPFSPFCFFSSVTSSSDYHVSRRNQKVTITATGAIVMGMANQGPSLQKLIFIQTVVGIVKLIGGHERGWME